LTNIRHYDNLMQTRNALKDVLNGLGQNVTGDFLAMDIRQSLHYLGEITGEITTDAPLDNIFSKFCIGK
jgi:tRNA modification GTPase